MAKSAHRRFADAAAERVRAEFSGRSVPAENWAATRSAIADHLDAFLARKTDLIDREMLVALLGALRQAEAKEWPDLFTPLPRARGESANPASVNDGVRAAVDYMLFCAAHKGKPWVDTAPVKTVCDVFGVTNRTALRWKQRAANVPTSAASGSALEDHLALLRAGLQSAAWRYASLGGASNAAVRARTKGDT